MGPKIQAHLIDQYPSFADVFRAVGVIPRLKPRDMPLPEAVVRVVIGQMLSADAARTIYARVKHAASERQVSGTWELHHRTLRACGLSRAKARTIREFGSALRRDPGMLDDWPELPSDILMKEITKFWGMSQWTASILALAYIGHQDIFPEGDGSLARAKSILEKRSRSPRVRLDPSKAAPYRSYLALYLWQALDRKVIK